MLTIATLSVPNQRVNVQLEGQPCGINLYQKGSRLYVDLYVNDVLIIGGVVAENANVIVRSAYLGFIGDLAIFDTQGSDDPQYTGLGSRWLLIYLEPADLAAA